MGRGLVFISFTRFQRDVLNVLAYNTMAYPRDLIPHIDSLFQYRKISKLFFVIEASIIILKSPKMKMLLF